MIPASAGSAPPSSACTIDLAVGERVHLAENRSGAAKKRRCSCTLRGASWAKATSGGTNQEPCPAREADDDSQREFGALRMGRLPNHAAEDQMQVAAGRQQPGHEAVVDQPAIAGEALIQLRASRSNGTSISTRFSAPAAATPLRGLPVVIARHGRRHLPRLVRGGLGQTDIRVREIAIDEARQAADRLAS